MTNQFVWVDIPVRELDRAIAFYSAVVGAPVKKDSFEGSSFGIFPHTETSVAGCLYEPKPGDNQPSQTGPLIYLNVSGRLDHGSIGSDSIDLRSLAHGRALDRRSPRQA